METLVLLLAVMLMPGEEPHVSVISTPSDVVCEHYSSTLRQQVQIAEPRAELRTFCVNIGAPGKPASIEEFHGDRG